jgi:hypothetical protein
MRSARATAVARRTRRPSLATDTVREGAKLIGEMAIVITTYLVISRILIVLAP